MTARAIDSAVRGLFKALWKRHLLMVSLLVQALLDHQRAGIAALGRALPVGTSPKHAIKRVDTFIGNPRFDDHAAQVELLTRVLGPRTDVLITVDWTKIRQWPTLVAGVVQRGRSVAVMWSVLDPRCLYKSVNAFENGFFSMLAAALPATVRATVLLDRGFKRVELMAHLRRCGLSFVIRTGGNVTVHSGAYRGRADALIRRRGTVVDLPDAVLRPSRPVRTRIVGVWDRGQKEPWILATDRPDLVRVVVRLYARRFRIEEMFRDEKDHRFGLCLGQLRLTKAARVTRMLLIVALAHLLAMLVGAHARALHLDRRYRANTGRNRTEHSDFTLGRYYYRRLRWRLKPLLIVLHEYREEHDPCAFPTSPLPRPTSTQVYGG